MCARGAQWGPAPLSVAPANKITARDARVPLKRISAQHFQFETIFIITHLPPASPPILIGTASLRYPEGPLKKEGRRGGGKKREEGGRCLHLFVQRERERERERERAGNNFLAQEEELRL